MPRTTLDIDASVLRELKRRQVRENTTLSRLVSELLARSLAAESSEVTTRPLRWRTKAMRARVDLEDAEAVRRAVDGQ